MTFRRFIIACCLILPLSSQAGSATYVAGEVLLAFNPSVSDAQIESFERERGLRRLTQFPHLNLFHYTLSTGDSTERAVSEFSADWRVQYVDYNFVHHAQSVQSYDDPKLTQQWYLNNNGVAGGKLDADIDWPEAMELYTGSQDVIVAVIDTGVTFEHPELIAKRWVNNGEIPNDHTDNDGNGYIDDVAGWDYVEGNNIPADKNGHGTAIASVIAASTNNQRGGAGISPHVKIMSLRILDDRGRGVLVGASTSLIAATTYAVKNGARILNLSLGGELSSAPVSAQMKWLDEQGVLVVAAAGNDARDIDAVNSGFYPASYGYDNIIAVAATTQDDELASDFSNYGELSVDLGAPGVEIVTADVYRGGTIVENFETEIINWGLSGASGAQWGLYQDGSGNHWLSDSVDYQGNPVDYRDTSHVVATSNAISLAGYFSPRLRFRMLRDLAPSDTFTVNVISGGVAYRVGEYGGKRSTPETVTFDLLTLDNLGDSIVIQFVLDTNGSGVADGVLIDDIEILSVSDFRDTNKEYDIHSGTSLAAPMVSGVAALLWSQSPYLTAKQVKKMILDGTNVLSDLNGKTVSGGRLSAVGSLFKTQHLQTGAIGFDTAELTVPDGAGDLELDVWRFGGLETQVQATIVFEAESAQYGQDYIGVTQTLVFPEGVAHRSVKLAIPQNTAITGNLTFVVKVKSAQGAQLAPVSSARVTIIDAQQSTNGFAFGNEKRVIAEQESKIKVTVVRLGDRSQSGLLAVDAGDSTASLGGDFELSTTSVIFAEGQASATLELLVHEDKLVEFEEAIVLRLLDSNGTLLAQQSVVVRDDDQSAANPGTFRFSRSGYQVSENGAKIQLVVERTGGSDGRVELQYVFQNGRAEKGKDFTYATNTIVFLDGVTRNVIDVDIIDNFVTTGGHADFNVELLSSVGCEICRATVSIYDDEAIPRTLKPTVANSSGGGSFFGFWSLTEIVALLLCAWGMSVRRNRVQKRGAA